MSLLLRNIQLWFLSSISLAMALSFATSAHSQSSRGLSDSHFSFDGAVVGCYIYFLDEKALAASCTHDATLFIGQSRQRDGVAYQVGRTFSGSSSFSGEGAMKSNSGPDQDVFDVVASLSECSHPVCNWLHVQIAEALSNPAQDWYSIEMVQNYPPRRHIFERTMWLACFDRTAIAVFSEDSQWNFGMRDLELTIVDNITCPKEY